MDNQPVIFIRGQVVAAGDRYGQWLVLDLLHLPKVEQGKRQHPKGLCRCDCGREREAFLEPLVRGRSTRCRSCDTSARNTKHGAANGPDRRLYGIWLGMRRRGRGDSNRLCYQEVRVCLAWEADFNAFRVWALASGYRDGLTIDRWPNQFGDYEPGNCRWATPRQQNRNKTDNHLLHAFGETKTVADWAEDVRCSVGVKTLYSRLYAGWDSAVAIATPRLHGGGRGGAPLFASLIKEEGYVKPKRKGQGR